MSHDVYGIGSRLKFFLMRYDIEVWVDGAIRTPAEVGRLKELASKMHSWKEICQIKECKILNDTGIDFKNISIKSLKEFQWLCHKNGIEYDPGFEFRKENKRGIHRRLERAIGLLESYARKGDVNAQNLLKEIR